MKWRYRSLSMTMLRAGIALFSKPHLACVFGGELVAMEMELLRRELPRLAEENRGYLVEWILGIQ